MWSVFQQSGEWSDFSWMSLGLPWVCKINEILKADKWDSFFLKLNNARGLKKYICGGGGGGPKGKVRHSIFLTCIYRKRQDTSFGELDDANKFLDSMCSF